MTGDGDVSKTGLQPLGPDGQPGDGVEVQAGGETEDDRPVLVHPQAGHGALLVSNLKTVGIGLGPGADHEERVWLISTKYQVLDHHGLTVDGHNIATVGSPASQSAQDLRLGKVELDAIWHQDPAYHLLKCDES